MLTRRIILHTLPSIARGALRIRTRNVGEFGCLHENFDIIQRTWERKSLDAKRRLDRATAVVNFYDTLLEDSERSRQFDLKACLLAYKQARPMSEENDQDFVDIWDQMNADYETSALMVGCTDV